MELSYIRLSLSQKQSCAISSDLGKAYSCVQETDSKLDQTYAPCNDVGQDVREPLKNHPLIVAMF
jgi:hypothetical protein